MIGPPVQAGAVIRVLRTSCDCAYCRGLHGLALVEVVALEPHNGRLVCRSEKESVGVTHWELPTPDEEAAWRLGAK